MKRYEYRDRAPLEPYYSAHVDAMTTEKLYHKADIAAELAWRDKQIEELTQTVLTQVYQLDSLYAEIENLQYELQSLQLQ